MKKIITSSSLLAIALMFIVSGCLKDKGFVNHEYGINDPDNSPNGVGFPLGTKTQAFGLNVSSTVQVVGGFVRVNLLSGYPAKTDVHVVLADNTVAAVAAYNAANGLTGTSSEVLPLPSTIYNIATSITIPAGQLGAEVPINVTNTTSLNPTRSYAISVNIVSSDNGYQVASNLKSLFILFSIKNRLDGIYEITGAALRAGDPALSGPVGTYERALATAGANSVQWIGSVYWGYQASQLPGGYEPLITVDPVTNLITNITSVSGIVMTAPVVRTDLIGTTQRYDPATKTLYFEFTYGGGPASRLFTMVAKYLRPR
jgi:hypothetical protein